MADAFPLSTFKVNPYKISVKNVNQNMRYHV